ncbi:MAG: SufE family protein [Spirochaetales bacterium]
METLQDRLAEVDAEFDLAGEWNDRYRLLVQWGTDLAPLPEAERTPDCFVSGCSSPLWLKVERGDQCRVRGFSPGYLPQALVALLVRLYDGLSPEGLGEVVDISTRLDLGRHLTPTRDLTFRRLCARVDQTLRLEAGAPV